MGATRTPATSPTLQEQNPYHAARCHLQASLHEMKEMFQDFAGDPTAGAAGSPRPVVRPGATSCLNCSSKAARTMAYARRDLDPQRRRARHPNGRAEGPNTKVRLTC